MSFTRRAAAVALGLFATSAVACDDGMPVCEPGQLRFAGRPPPRLFAYDQTCRADCFSQPRNADCDRECDEVLSGEPAGLNALDRDLWLFDLGSLDATHVLAYRFGFVDEAGGSAPADWGFLGQGPRTYLSDELQGTARFGMSTQVSPAMPLCNGSCGASQSCVDTGDDNVCLRSCDPAAPACDAGLTCLALANPEGFPGLCAPASGGVAVGGRYVGFGASGDPATVVPGRLEVTSTGGRITGRFFLAYQTPTGQPQGEVLGCFDLAVGQPEGTADAPFWRLVP